MSTPYWSLPTPNIDALIKHKKGNQMTDKQVLREVKKLSNGKFGKPMVFEGDAQIVIQRFLKRLRLKRALEFWLSNSKRTNGKVKED